MSIFEEYGAFKIGLKSAVELFMHYKREFDVAKNASEMNIL